MLTHTNVNPLTPTIILLPHHPFPLENYPSLLSFHSSPFLPFFKQFHSIFHQFLPKWNPFPCFMIKATPSFLPHINVRPSPPFPHSVPALTFAESVKVLGLIKTIWRNIHCIAFKNFSTMIHCTLCTLYFQKKIDDYIDTLIFLNMLVSLEYSIKKAVHPS